MSAIYSGRQDPTESGSFAVAQCMACRLPCGTSLGGSLYRRGVTHTEYESKAHRGAGGSPKSARASSAKEQRRGKGHGANAEDQGRSWGPSRRYVRLRHAAWVRACATYNAP